MLFRTRFLSLLGATYALGSECPEVPADYTLPSPLPTQLPDPFLKVDGTRVTSKEDWSCRHDELSQLFQTFQYGAIPGPPDSLDAYMNGTQLVVDIQHADRSISFTANVTLPSRGEAPYPALITLGGLSIPVPDDVAVVIYNNDEIAGPRSNGPSGDFYALYGHDTDAGFVAGTIWGLSRLIDALELVPDSGIDATRLGVTGCSRNSRIALPASAMDPRLALTIAQEGGAAADVCWRIASQHSPSFPCSPLLPCQEWPDYGLSTAINQFMNYLGELPVDQHLLAGMIAPRALLVLQNDIEWLQPAAGFKCMEAAHTVWEALGVPERMGWSLVGGHNHCSVPAAQEKLIEAYIRKFLVGEEVEFDTEVAEMGSQWVELDDFRVWAPWDVPDLE